MKTLRQVCAEIPKGKCFAYAGCGRPIFSQRPDIAALYVRDDAAFISYGDGLVVHVVPISDEVLDSDFHKLTPRAIIEFCEKSSRFL